MPRAEAGTPKAISNAIKSKGLQKLMFFCQACQKQCRDANGFKCHTMSEAHQRQLLLVAENPGKYLEDFSKEFLHDFMQLFRTRFSSKRVFANQVYQEYIKDRYHVHMNSTKWLSLSGFVQWLGRHGYATVDQSEKGWYITYIDRDPETLRRQESLLKKDKMEKDYEERMAKIIEEQVAKGSIEALQIKEESKESKELVRNEEEKIVLQMSLKNRLEEKKLLIKEPKEKLEYKDIEKKEQKIVDEKKDKKLIKSSSSSLLKRSALDDIMEEEQRKKAKTETKNDDKWITKGIIVKLTSKKLPEKYYMNKGVIERVEGYVAFVKILKGNALIKADQAHLETVIPKEGNIVRIVSGLYKNEDALLLKVDLNKLRAKLEIKTGKQKGKVLEKVEFEEFCKISKD